MYSLAQINIARMLAPLSYPLMAELVAQLDEVNAFADASPGFIWRLQTAEGNATDVRAYEDDLILFNMSVWASLMAAIQLQRTNSIWKRMYFDFKKDQSVCNRKVSRMIKERRVATEWPVSGPINDGAALARTRTLETPAGTLLVQDHCRPAFVESLRVDSGLHAFARLPEREHQLLITIAKRADCRLTLVYTPEGVIVAEVTLAPGDAWWAGLEHVYEGAVQVSSNWRRLGIARQLLALALELDIVEDMIIFALGLSWHWDTEGLGINGFQYRKLIERLFATYGFVEYLTSEPNITMDPANIFLARIGSRVDLQTINQFYNRMLSSQNLPGLSFC